MTLWPLTWSLYYPVRQFTFSTSTLKSYACSIHACFFSVIPSYPILSHHASNPLYAISCYCILNLFYKLALPLCKGSSLETLVLVFHVGSTPTFLYFYTETIFHYFYIPVFRFIFLHCLQSIYFYCTN